MKTNLLIAASIAVALAAWMILGQLFAQDEKPPQAGAAAHELASVRVRDSQAQSYSASLTLRGATAAARSSLLKSEVAGPVAAIVAPRGSVVGQGDVLIQIDPQSLPQQLEAAEAQLAQRSLEHDAAQKLRATGFQSETRLAETTTLLADAKNQLAATQIALDNTVIRAPYDGVFNERLVEVGEWVAQGDPVARFLELNPMIVVAQATEREIREIKVGAPAQARIGEATVSGRIRYLSLQADEAVRTYTVEFEFPNPDLAFQAGLTADLLVQASPQLAHKVSPSILYLGANADGQLGLKTVDEQNRVTFHPTTILGSDADGVWVSGLPERARIITVGQGFVKPGATVKAVDESAIP